MGKLPKQPPKPKLTLWEMLQTRYRPAEYALMAEVRDAAGHGASRSADFLAVNLWPSRGLAIEGIELKSYRGDWLSELKNPKKAEAIFKYCDYFWLLTTDDTIAKLEEIPVTWGWMCVQGNRIIVKKEAPKLEPTPCTRSFIVAMLKRAADKSNFVHIDSIQTRIDEAKLAAKTKAENNKDYRVTKADELIKDVKAFEEASGLQITQYGNYGHTLKKVGQAVKFLMNGGTDNILNLFKQFRGATQSMNENLNTVIAELEANPKLEVLQAEVSETEEEPSANNM